MEQEIIQQIVMPFVPGRPGKLEDAGLSPSLVADLLLKTLYYNRQMTGSEIAAHVCLPFDQIVNPILSELRRDALVISSGAPSTKPNDPQFIRGYAGSFRYELSESGAKRAAMAADRCAYCGPAPVPLNQYIDACQQQTIRHVSIQAPQLREGVSHLVLSEEMLNELGPALNSGRSIFFYGNTGNGKSAVAQSVSNMLTDSIWIPRCLEVAGNIVLLFDEAVHNETMPKPRTDHLDTRWVRIHRPSIVTAGELTLDNLNLSYDETTHTYEAPLQVKANNGVFVIDDLGRQTVSPQQLLNRWIYPLEHRTDYLTLRTGRQLSVPFDVLLIFCTNLKPLDLADEAFLRRIKHKIAVGDPTDAQFREIFSRECAKYQLPYEDKLVTWLLTKFYRPYKRPLRGCHPRDILEQIADIARYRRQPIAISQDLLKLAAQTYFVQIDAPAGSHELASKKDAKKNITETKKRVTKTTSKRGNAKSEDD